MDYAIENRKKIAFRVPQGIHYNDKGIYSENGILYFPKKVSQAQADKGYQAFKDATECEHWYAENIPALKGMFDPSEKQYRDIAIGFKDVESTTADWTLAQKFMPHSENFEQDDFRIYHPRMANNFVDRSRERFPVKVLRAFARTLPGKPLLLGHKKPDPGEGVLFKAVVKKYSIEENIEIVAANAPKNFRQHLELVESIDGGIFFLEGAFYVLASDKKLTDRLDAGIYRNMSLGFRCDGITEYKDGPDFLWWEYVDKGGSEGLEASIVWVGDQRGTQNEKTFNGNPCADIRGEEHPNPSDESGEVPGDKNINNGGDSMPKEFKIQVGEKDFTVTDEKLDGLQDVQKAFDETLTDEKSKTTVAQDERDKAVTERDEATGELEKYKSAFGEIEKAKELTDRAEAGDKYKAFLVDEIIEFKGEGYLGLLEDDPEKVTAEKTLLEGMTVEQLEAQRKQVMEKYAKENPGSGILRGEDSAKGKKQINTTPKSAFMVPA